MTVAEATTISWDPYDAQLTADPYPIYRRMREELPLYYNEQFDFYALSRYSDVESGLRDPVTYSSARGNILELIKSGMEIPPGTLIMEDPPVHTVHRKLLAKVFTPKRMAEIEPQIREFCAVCLDPLVGAQRFDIVAALAAQMPMRVISMLLGIPDEDQESVRDRVDDLLRTEDGGAMDLSKTFDHAQFFGDYIDWRAKHPSDDLMTDLLQAEFEDEHGVTRRLTREELMMYLSIVAGAGNETTTRLIGWTAKLLAEHPDQRQELVADPSLIPQAVDEVLRYEAPGPLAARYVTRDVEHHGSTVPEGSTLIFLIGSANRDDRQFPDGDRFDIHRKIGQMVTFGFGAHYCLGANLAKLEGRVALEELLKRFPEWDIDLGPARLSPTSTVRGWETLPLVLP